MVDANLRLDPGLAPQGYPCPATSLGLRAGAAAMNALGVSRAAASRLVALVELGDEYGGMCFFDGVETITGCTFDKGTIEWLHSGDNWSVTLVDVEPRRAVRVAPKVGAPLIARLEAFSREYREKGVPASEVPSDVVVPLVESLMQAPDGDLLAVSGVFPYPRRHRPAPTPTFLCETCGEMEVEGAPAARR